MANDFVVGICVGVLIAAFSARSISRALDSLPEHEETSRKLADLLALKDLAKALFGTAGVGRDLLHLAILLTKLFFGWLIMLIVNATISPTLSRTIADSLRGKRERKEIQLSPFLPPLIVVCIVVGAVATLLLKPVGKVQVASSGWALFGPSAQQARGQEEADFDLSDEAAVVEYISGLARKTMRSLASALQQLQEANPMIDGAAAAPLPRVAWQVGVGFVVSMLAYWVKRTQGSGMLFVVEDDAGRATSDFGARFGCYLARGASWLLMALCVFPFLRLYAVMWQLHIEKGAPGPELQQGAAKSLDMVVDHTFWHCLAHTAVVAFTEPSAFVKGLTRAASAAFPSRPSNRVADSMPLEHYAGAALLMPVRAAVAVALAACWLLAVAPPTYVFWHAATLRLSASKSENWVQLLQLGVTVAARLVLKTAQDGLPTRLGRTWVFARAHIIAETAVVATAMVPVFTAVPAISAALVQSKLAERGPTRPSWAALLLLLPTVLAMAARGKEISDNLCDEPNSPLLASHPWLRSVLHHCGWDGGLQARRRRLGLELVKPAQGGAAATVRSGLQPPRLIRLIKAVNATLPKALHLHAAAMLELAYEVGLGSFNWKDYPQRDVEAPLFAALRSALRPLGLHASRLLRHAALTEHGRDQLKVGIRELKDELRAIHGVLLTKEDHYALEQQLDKALKYLEAPGLIGLKGSLRLPVPPEAAVRVELVVSHEKTKQLIEQEHLDKLVDAVDRVARAALKPHGRTIKEGAVKCSSSMRTVHHGERTKLVALLATSSDTDGMIDDFLSDDHRSKIVEALKADGSPLRNAAAAQQELKLIVHGEPKITVDKKGKESIRLADGVGAYEVPIPLKTVAETLEKCVPDDKPKYGAARDYDKDNFEIDIGGCILGSSFRVCVNLPFLGCTIFYFENFAIDVRLTSGTNTDQLVTLALREWISHKEGATKRDQESAEKGASGCLCELLVELTIDHPEVLVGDGKSTQFGMVTESDKYGLVIPIRALRTTEAVPKPFKLAGGRYQAAIVLTVEGGEDFKAEGFEVPPHVKAKGPGLYWGFDKNRTAFVGDATFKGLDGPSRKTVEKAVGANKAKGWFNYLLPTTKIVKVLLSLLTHNKQAGAVSWLVTFIATEVLKMQPIIRREQLEMNNASLITFVKEAKGWQDEKKRRDEEEHRLASKPELQRERSWKWLHRATRGTLVPRADTPPPEAVDAPAPAEPAPPPEPVKQEKEWWQFWIQEEPEPKAKRE